MCGGGIRITLSRRSRGDLNVKESNSSRVSAERPATIACGGMYPEPGISSRRNEGGQGW